MLNPRIKTGALILLSVCLILALSHIPPVLDCTAVFLSLAAVTEMCRALSISRRPWIFASAAELLVLLLLPRRAFLLLTAAVFTLVLVLFLLAMTRFEQIRDIPRWFRTVLLLAIPLFFVGMRYIRLLAGGLVLLTLALFVCMLTDSLAYLFGRRFGRHKLAPRVSPSKTIEGSLGGTVGTMVLILLAAWFLQQLNHVAVAYVPLIAYLLSASVISQLGDLSMSVVKRVVKIKDYGTLLPGHGGILDRFDSLLFVLPYTYLFFTLVPGLF